MRRRAWDDRFVFSGRLERSLPAAVRVDGHETDARQGHKSVDALRWQARQPFLWEVATARNDRLLGLERRGNSARQRAFAFHNHSRLRPSLRPREARRAGQDSPPPECRCFGAEPIDERALATTTDYRNDRERLSFE